MASIKSKNTKIEKIIKNILLEMELEYEENPSNVFGKPDFILREAKVAIYCDGDFWHGYDMDSNPRLNVKNNREFWISKIKKNKERDEKVNRTLISEGWLVVRFWEHDIISNVSDCRKKLERIARGVN